MGDTTDEVRACEEAILVDAWRARILVEVGYPGKTAVLLAEQHAVDVHAVRDQVTALLAAGCPLRLALRIAR